MELGLKKFKNGKVGSKDDDMKKRIMLGDELLIDWVRSLCNWAFKIMEY